MDELKDAKANAGSAANRSSNLTGSTHELGRPAQVMLMLPPSLFLSGKAFVIPWHSACTVVTGSELSLAYLFHSACSLLHAHRVANSADICLAHWGLRQGLSEVYCMRSVAWSERSCVPV